MGSGSGPDRSVASWQVYHNRQVALMVERMAEMTAALWDLQKRVRALEESRVSRETQLALWDLDERTK